eukprot:CAMPEP_0195007548 /NCGR_PEP_ID=MMETSP0326_2-20130528/7718_1 /TAXON_ID=2866 ORGANISM="Crypthecodinium cohnii, Strain Seligo" /NCGR_SAMPLE_ID=MMETSP0326_2 /ASSEMBLY_ACC=CAM_ASM_000348 /LENGTH=37 /DNA_ID= /DNA_START= /DNA_END= /DNA_ORIENTATION=
MGGEGSASLQSSGHRTLSNTKTPERQNPMETSDSPDW